MSTATHAVGASASNHGITIALALPTGATEPDPDRFFVRQGLDWQLVDIRDIARRTTLALPIELRHPYFAHAHDDRLHAAARWLARLAAAGAGLSPAKPLPPEAPRPWWLNL